MKKLHALVLGATGQELVKLLLKDSNFSKVSIFVRRTIGKSIRCWNDWLN